LQIIDEAIFVAITYASYILVVVLIVGERTATEVISFKVIIAVYRVVVGIIVEWFVEVP
jgi:hypothetical protein